MAEKKKENDGQEDKDFKEDYKTYWEQTSKEFEAQLCSATRKLGKNDIGRIKIKPDKDYNVYVGARVFYSKVSTDMQVYGDVKEPYVMRLDFKSEDKDGGETDEDGARSIMSTIGVIVSLSLTMWLI